MIASQSLWTMAYFTPASFFSVTLDISGLIFCTSSPWALIYIDMRLIEGRIWPENYHSGLRSFWQCASMTLLLDCPGLWLGFVAVCLNSFALPIKTILTVLPPAASLLNWQCCCNIRIAEPFIIIWWSQMLSKGSFICQCMFCFNV